MKEPFKSKREKVVPLLIDIFFINIALACGFLLHPRITSLLPVILEGPLWDYFRTFAPITVTVRLFFLFFFSVYEQNKETPAYKSIEKIFKATTLGTIIIFTIIHGLRNYYFVDIGLSRYSCFLEWSLNIIFLFGWRVIYFQVVPKVLRVEGRPKNTLILGVSEEGLRYLTELSKVPFHHWQVVGYLPFDSEKSEDSLYQPHSLKCLDNGSNFLEIINQYQVENVVVASNRCPIEPMSELIVQCHALSVRVFILPRLYEIFAGKLKLRPMESMPIFEVIWEPISGFNKALKRLFDIAFSLMALVLTFPIMVLIALLIKTTSKGPVLFKQVRIGKDNKPFKIYKFRSMVDQAESTSGPVWAGSDDPRVTKVGRFLRKTSLDELPQLFLVLTGKLSIVGPRPERPHFVYKYEDFQGLRLSIQPGLTGLAQVNGRYEANLSEKIYNDIYYINNYSFYLDMVIVMKTIWSVVTGKGAR